MIFVAGNYVWCYWFDVGLGSVYNILRHAIHPDTRLQVAPYERPALSKGYLLPEGSYSLSASRAITSNFINDVLKSTDSHVICVPMLWADCQISAHAIRTM